MTAKQPDSFHGGDAKEWFELMEAYFKSSLPENEKGKMRPLAQTYLRGEVRAFSAKIEGVDMPWGGWKTVITAHCEALEASRKKEEAPARRTTATCQICGGKNHIASRCRKR